MFEVKAEAPTRVDLAGGTLDINPLFQVLDSPQTVNVGVTLNAQVRVKHSVDRKIHIRSLDQNVTNDVHREKAEHVESLLLDMQI